VCVCVCVCVRERERESDLGQIISISFINLFIQLTDHSNQDVPSAVSYRIYI